MQIRPALESDALGIHAIINEYFFKGLMLSRSVEDITRSIDKFIVAVNDKKRTIVGCSSIYIYNQNLSEIRSLAVLKKYRGMGFGRQLLTMTLDIASEFKIEKIFALTLEVDFFLRHDFKIIKRDELPEKIWQDCLNCPSHPDCREIALIHKLK